MNAFDGEDNYAYEEEQERKALLQSLHGPMKTWYNSSETTRYANCSVSLLLSLCYGGKDDRFASSGFVFKSASYKIMAYRGLG